MTFADCVYVFSFSCKLGSECCVTLGALLDFVEGNGLALVLVVARIACLCVLSGLRRLDDGYFVSIGLRTVGSVYPS